MRASQDHQKQHKTLFWLLSSLGLCQRRTSQQQERWHCRLTARHFHLVGATPHSRSFPFTPFVRKTVTPIRQEFWHPRRPFPWQLADIIRNLPQIPIQKVNHVELCHRVTLSDVQMANSLPLCWESGSIPSTSHKIMRNQSSSSPSSPVGPLRLRIFLWFLVLVGTVPKASCCTCLAALVLEQSLPVGEPVEVPVSWLREESTSVSCRCREGAKIHWTMSCPASSLDLTRKQRKAFKSLFCAACSLTLSTRFRAASTISSVCKRCSMTAGSPVHFLPTCRELRGRGHPALSVSIVLVPLVGSRRFPLSTMASSLCIIGWDADAWSTTFSLLARFWRSCSCCNVSLARAITRSLVGCVVLCGCCSGFVWSASVAAGANMSTGKEMKYVCCLVTNDHPLSMVGWWHRCG